MFVHANLSPIKALIREDVLYNMDASKAGNYVPCSIIGVSSYPGSTPTFQIVVEGESLFSYIPPHLLLMNKTDLVPSWTLKDLVYHNCPSAEFALSVSEFLLGKKLSIYLRGVKGWVDGKYLFTLDWYEGNDLLHCVVLSNGQFGFFPQHKISLGKQEFKPYQKLRQEWKE